MKNNKGFTLVELLAVIVILGIIMIIAIPSVLETMQVAKTKSLEEYAQKVRNAGERKYLVKKEFEGLPSPGSADVELYVYDVKEDLDLTNTGNFEGIFLMYKFDNSFFNKVKLEGESSKRIKPNTPYFGVALTDGENILTYLGQNVDSLEQSIVMSIEDVKTAFIKTLPEGIDIPSDAADLYVNGFKSKEGFFNYYRAELNFIQSQIDASGMSPEQVDAMFPDDKTVKFMIVDGKTNTVILSSKFLSPRFICSCDAEPKQNA